MALMLIDLDDTLVDRAAAFRRWAEQFALRHSSAAESDVDWLVEMDADGYTPRERLVREIEQRFGADSVAGGVSALRQGVIEHLQVDQRVLRSLVCARAEGWTAVVVTNGGVEQQELKLRVTGLASHVTAWVISEDVGVKKPHSTIFEEAARAGGQPLRGSWMIGDSPDADIVGAANVGARTVWLDRGRVWPREDIYPSETVTECYQAIDLVRATSVS